MSSISSKTLELINKYQVWHQSVQKQPEEATIHVDEVASKVASFYEKIRGVVDWKEEHLFRKGAIERILKRRLLFKRTGEDIAAPMIYELIRGGHLPNDTIREKRVEEVKKTLTKYIYILENATTPKKRKLAEQFNDWVLGIAACEIEEILSPSTREVALIDYMAEVMKEKIRVREGILVMKGISDEEKDIQIYIAAQRALLNPDVSLLTYRLLNKKGVKWFNPSQEELENITKNIYSLREDIDSSLNHPLSDKFYNVCERYDTPYLILGDVLSEDIPKAKEILSNPSELESKTRQAYNRRAATLKTRMSRAAFYATLSIFLTNIFSLYVIEFPLAKFVLGYFSPLAIAVDILAPTFLMFLLIVTISPPPKENLDVTVMEVMKIVYEEKSRDVYEVKPKPKRSLITRTIIGIFYLLGFSMAVALIIWALADINLPVTSDIIFIIFISLITFAGTKIRRRAKELEVIETKESFIFFIVDLFAIPTAQLGKWLSNRWKKYNAIGRFFSYLIDMPFQIFVEFLEQWRYFMKEKKEEIH